MTDIVPVVPKAVDVTRLTFNDNFSGFVSSPDGSAGWMTQYTFGGETNYTLPAVGDAEFYSSPSANGVNPFSLDKGVLTISATPAAAGSNPYNLPYNSGIITTAGDFHQQYGYFQVVADLPSGQGLWPAFWMIPSSGDYAAELDINEAIGTTTSMHSTVHGTYDGGAYGGDSQVFDTPAGASGYHAYGVDWEAGTTTFYFDGQAVGSTPTPTSMSEPMYMLLCLAVGGPGSWPGAPDGSTVFPAQMRIASVQAYATAGTVEVGGRAAIPPGTSSQISRAAPAPSVVSPTRSAMPPIPSHPSPDTLTIGAGSDIIAVQVAEAADAGDATYSISVDGRQVGGTQTATALAATGYPQTVNVEGNFGAGPHIVSINLLNGLAAGSTTNRVLYVDGATLNGTAIANSTLALTSSGAQAFAFTEPFAAAALPPPTPVPVSSTTPVAIGSGSDRVTLGLSEDAWRGDAQFTINIDGKPIGGTQTVTASQARGQVQTFDVRGQWGAGAHTVGISFINDAWGGTSATDRNLYIDDVSYNGASATPAAQVLYTNSTADFAVAPQVRLLLAEDAYKGNAKYAVSVDGKQVGSASTVTASNAAGKTQAVTLPTELTAEVHDITVTFLNDLYRGTPATDRNLYVKAVEVNGIAIAGGSAALLANGGHDFLVTILAH